LDENIPDDTPEEEKEVGVTENEMQVPVTSGTSLLVTYIDTLFSTPHAGEKLVLGISSEQTWRIKHYHRDWLRIIPETGKGESLNVTLQIVNGFDPQGGLIEIYLENDNSIRKVIPVRFVRDWKWGVDEVNAFLERIEDESYYIDMNEVFLHFDQECEVYIYKNGVKGMEKAPIRPFIKYKRGKYFSQRPVRALPDRIRYDSSTNKIIELGVEEIDE
jgi:hypothetical protein